MSRKCVENDIKKRWFFSRWCSTKLHICHALQNIAQYRILCKYAVLPIYTKYNFLHDTQLVIFAANWPVTALSNFKKNIHVHFSMLLNCLFSFCVKMHLECHKIHPSCSSISSSAFLHIFCIT